MAEIRVDDLESLRHDPLCPAPGSTVHGCICVELRERDARVRADERARELQASRETALTVASNVAALERHHIAREAKAERDAVRAEVAEEIAQAIERKHADAMTQYRMERSTYWEGSTDAYDTAARIARQIGGVS